jgi:two-component system, cell cycle sensor histidine kinase and response regulator CckA
MSESAAGDLFQALVEYSSDAIVLADIAGRMVFLSHTAERLLGYPTADRLGKSIFEHLHPDDVPRAQGLFDELLREPHVPKTLVVRNLHRDGGWRYIEAVVVNRLNEPAVRAIVTNFRDITERTRAEEALRESEAKYRFFIERAAFGIYRSTDDGRILEANPAFARMLGCGSVDEVMGLNMADVYQSEADRATLLDAHRGKEGGTSEVRWKKKTGEPILVRLTAHTVVGSDGRESYETIAEDITERRALEDQLRRAQKMEAIGRLARGIAHDFNNVLAAIVGSSDLLAHRYPDDHPAHLEAVEIRKAAERGAAFTRQLLAFGRQQAFEPQPVDIHAAGRAFESTLQRILGNAVTLNIHAPGKPPVVRMEPGQFEQVLMNLAVNARDAMPDGGAIDVTLDSVDVNKRNAARYPGLPAYRYARVAVRDSGVGIDPDLQRQMFEPFVTTKNPDKGTGLGLSIVYTVAKDAGGTVTCTSAPGKGTTFEVLLPLMPNP